MYMKHFILWRGLSSQTKFSYLTHNPGPRGLGNLRPTGGASGYLQPHFRTEGWGGGGVPLVVGRRGGLCFTFGQSPRCTRLGGLESSQPCPFPGVGEGEGGDG